MVARAVVVIVVRATQGDASNVVSAQQLTRVTVKAASFTTRVLSLKFVIDALYTRLYEPTIEQVVV